MAFFTFFLWTKRTSLGLGIATPTWHAQVHDSSQHRETWWWRIPATPQVVLVVWIVFALWGQLWSVVATCSGFIFWIPKVMMIFVINKEVGGLSSKQSLEGLRCFLGTKLKLDPNVVWHMVFVECQNMDHDMYHWNWFFEPSIYIICWSFLCLHTSFDQSHVLNLKASSGWWFTRPNYIIIPKVRQVHWGKISVSSFHLGFNMSYENCPLDEFQFHGSNIDPWV